MTPKDKAKELLYKFKGNRSKKWSDPFIESPYTCNAKHCALICVDEILKEVKYNHRDTGKAAVGIWNKVKQEINKL